MPLNFIKNGALLIRLLAVAVIGLLAYSNSFHAPFFFDDLTNIIWNSTITDLTNFFNSDQGYKTNPRRFIGTLTLALNYHFNGSDVFGYHLVNFAIHLLNAFMLYYLIILLHKTPAFTADGRSAPTAAGTAFPAALLFVSHPLATQSVTYIVQRYTSLATFFFLLATAAYCKGRAAIKSGPGTAWLFLAGLAALLAMKTKEIAFTLPLVIILLELQFFKPDRKKIWLLLLPAMGLLLIVPLSVLNTERPLTELLAEIDAATRVDTDLSRWSYLITQFRVIATYLRLLLLPVGQNLDYDVPAYHTLLAPQVLPALLLHMLLLALGVWLLRRSRCCGREILGLAALGIFWFYITLAVESSLLPIADLIFEHRTYLPCAGAFMTMAALWAMLRAEFPDCRRGRADLIVPALVIALLAFATHERNKVWLSEIAMWEDVARKSPRKARVHNNLGTAYQMAGNTNRAMQQYEVVLKLDPANAEAHNNLGVALRNRGETAAALRHYARALELQPDNAMTLNNLASIHEELGDTAAALDHYRQAVALKPAFVPAQTNLGNLYQKMGRLDEARQAFTIALALKPDYVKAVYGLGMTLLALGDPAGAITYLQKAVAITPDYSEAHNNLGVIYAAQGDYESARQHFTLAVQANPENSEASQNLDRIRSLRPGSTPGLP